MSDDEKEEGKGKYNLLKYLAGLFKEIGLPGFIVVIITFIFLTFSSGTQKEEFIDKWILMKKVEETPFPFIFVVLILLFLIVFSWISCRRVHKLDKGEIKRLGEEKSRLQEDLLDKKLNTSGK